MIFHKLKFFPESYFGKFCRIKCSRLLRAVFCVKLVKVKSPLFNTKKMNKNFKKPCFRPSLEFNYTSITPQTTENVSMKEKFQFISRERRCPCFADMNTLSLVALVTKCFENHEEFIMTFTLTYKIPANCFGFYALRLFASLGSKAEND